PPLRERTSEIEGLARTFLARSANEEGRARAPDLSPEALAVLLKYSWPGNIRELRNVIERAVLLCTGDVVTLHHSPIEQMAIPVAPPALLSLPPADPARASEEQVAH